MGPRDAEDDVSQTRSPTVQSHCVDARADVQVQGAERGGEEESFDVDLVLSRHGSDSEASDLASDVESEDEHLAATLRTASTCSMPPPPEARRSNSRASKDKKKKGNAGDQRENAKKKKKPKKKEESLDSAGTDYAAAYRAWQQSQQTMSSYQAGVLESPIKGFLCRESESPSSDSSDGEE